MAQDQTDKRLMTKIHVNKSATSSEHVATHQIFNILA